MILTKYDNVRGGNETKRQSIARTVVAALAGSALEWYDFGLYGASAALVFGQLFFPEFSSIAGTLAAFATYAIGFFARPIGGIIFSHYGDKVGRKPVLAATLLLMGSATCLMGLLPTYQSVGLWAPVLLVLLRLIQGLGAGAEYGGAALLLAEQRPAHRAFYGSFAASGVFVGLVLSVGIFSIVTTPLSREALLSWGWRVPYLLSVVVIGVGLYLRYRTPETPEFAKEVQEMHQEARVPLLTLFRTYPKQLLIAMGANLSLVGYSYVVQTFVLTYVTADLGLPRNTGLLGVVLGAGLGAATMPAFGALADRIGARRVIMAGAAFSALFAFPFFWLLDTRETALVWLAIVLGLAVGVGSMFGPIAAFYHDLFQTRVRYTGLVFARETTGAVVGGLTPLIATALVAWSGGSPWPVALYMIVTVLIPLVAVYFADEPSRQIDQTSGPVVHGRALSEHAS
ncbi:MAG: MHS family MFS transporter [Acetobacteraceae bacterium]|nr:MHS family MFS transporter [Acetobacteraceae bacterium]